MLYVDWELNAFTHSQYGQMSIEQPLLVVLVIESSECWIGFVPGLCFCCFSTQSNYSDAC